MKKPKVSALWRYAMTLIITVLISFLCIPKSVSQEVSEVPQVQQETEKEVAVHEKIDVPKLLWDISWCESRNDQSRIGLNKKDGVVWSRDIGLFQINDYYHEEAALKMGYDIYTVEGNTKYALYLYNINGTRDWEASKSCWQDIDAWRTKTQEPFYQ